MDQHVHQVELSIKALRPTLWSSCNTFKALSANSESKVRVLSRTFNAVVRNMQITFQQRPLTVSFTSTGKQDSPTKMLRSLHLQQVLAVSRRVAQGIPKHVGRMVHRFQCDPRLSHSLSLSLSLPLSLSRQLSGKPYSIHIERPKSKPVSFLKQVPPASMNWRMQHLYAFIMADALSTARPPTGLGRQPH